MGKANAMGSDGAAAFGDAFSALAGDLSAGSSFVGAIAGAASEEYNARRAKALALLDENFSSLLANTAGKAVDAQTSADEGLSPRALACLGEPDEDLEAPPTLGEAPTISPG